MEYYSSREWRGFLNNSLDEILSMVKIPYSEITPSVIPERKGIYIISEMVNDIEVILYIGRSKNLRNRIYLNHLMGSTSNARLKNYMIKDSNHSCFENIELAKKYIKEKCYVRWFFEEDVRKRGALEAYFTAILFPKYGISEEH